MKSILTYNNETVKHIYIYISVNVTIVLIKYKCFFICQQINLVNVFANF